MDYDDEDRLVQVSGAGPNQTYSYNGLDARRTKTYGATTSTYKRASVSPTAPVVSDGQATYTPGISERRSGVSKWAHQDYMGSTKALTDSTQSVTDTRRYDAFGLQTGATGSTPTPFGFAGGWGYQSDETGLHLLGHRYYDPSTGRFLTRDPIKDGRNWYAYCDNNPVGYVDPTGLQDEGLWIGYGILLRVAQMPPWAQRIMLGLLGMTPAQLAERLKAGQALLQGGAGELVDDAIPVASNAFQKLASNGSNVWQLTQRNFPQFAAPNSAGVRVVNGNVQSVAVYDPWGQIFGRLDLFSRSGRFDHGFPHFHVPGPGGSWPGTIVPGIPPHLPFFKSGLHIPLRR